MTNKLNKWLKINNTKFNEEKCKLLLLERRKIKVEIQNEDSCLAAI